MVDWTSGKIALKLTASIQGTDDIDEFLPMYNNFSSTVNQQYERIHGTGPGEYNAGIVKKIPVYSFTIDVFANSGELEGTEIASTARLLRALMVSRKPFDIYVMQRDKLNGVMQTAQNDSFQLRVEQYSKSYVRSMDVDYRVEEAPVATFDCVAYRFDPSYEITGSWKAMEAYLGDGILQTLDTSVGEIEADLKNLFSWEEL